MQGYRSAPEAETSVVVYRPTGVVGTAFWALALVVAFGATIGGAVASLRSIPPSVRSRKRRV